MQWRSYWLRHEGDSLPYNTLGVLLSAKEIHIFGSFSSNIDSNKCSVTTTNDRLYSSLRPRAWPEKN